MQQRTFKCTLWCTDLYASSSVFFVGKKKGKSSPETKSTSLPPWCYKHSEIYLCVINYNIFWHRTDSLNASSTEDYERLQSFLNFFFFLKEGSSLKEASSQLVRTPLVQPSGISTFSAATWGFTSKRSTQLESPYGTFTVMSLTRLKWYFTPSQLALAHQERHPCISLSFASSVWRHTNTRQSQKIRK